MKRTLLGLCSVVLLALLLSGCGGGDNGVTPPAPEDVSRLFPLTPGTTQVYALSETQHTYAKITGALAAGLFRNTARENPRVGPFSLPIVIPKSLLPSRNGTTHIYEETRDDTGTGTDTSTIDGTHTGDPFPAGVTTTIEETNEQGAGRETYQRKLDGEIIEQGDNPYTWDDWYRDFYTNENGEVLWWGSQEENAGVWGEIEPYDSPLLMFKAGASSWKVGHIYEDLEDVVFSADIVADLAGRETITVPAGTFTCYKIIYRLTNMKLEQSPSDIQITSYKLNSTTTMWLALDKGIVKSEDKTSVSLTFREQEMGAVGTISGESSYTQTLKPAG